MNDDVGDGRSEGSARHDGEGNNNDRHDGGNGWMDAPPDPSPGIIPGPEVDTAAQRRNLVLQGRQSTELREAARRSNPGSGVSVVSVSPARGQVRFTDPDGRTWVETWFRSHSGWAPARG